MIGRVTAAVMAALLLVACGGEESTSPISAITPREGRSGLQLTGTVGGRQVVVNDGAPVLRAGDCDVNDGPDADVCFFSRRIDGDFFAVIIENPDVLAPGTVEVVSSSCRSPECNHVTDGAVVDVGFAPDESRVRATGGRLRIDIIEPGRRYSGTMSLELPNGRIDGHFEVVPRPDEP